MPGEPRNKAVYYRCVFALATAWRHRNRKETDVLKSFAPCAAFAALSTLLLVPLSASATPAPGDTKPNKTTHSRDAHAQGKASEGSSSAWQEYLKSADRHAGIGEALAHKALSYRGVPYRFGGTSENGIDCSGLTQAVYKKWGMMLPRTSTEQFKKGKPVPKDQLRPGDLVFFKNTYRHGVSHVGIYVGDGKFVHAAGAKYGVIVSSLNEPYHLHHYAGARRIALDSQPVKAERRDDDDQPKKEDGPDTQDKQD